MKADEIAQVVDATITEVLRRDLVDWSERQIITEAIITELETKETGGMTRTMSYKQAMKWAKKHPKGTHLHVIFSTPRDPAYDRKETTTTTQKGEQSNEPIPTNSKDEEGRLPLL